MTKQDASNGETKILELQLKVDENNRHLKVSQLLADHSSLSQSKIKDAMKKGAVWLLRGTAKQRIRRASKALRTGDVIELNYNDEILNQTIPQPRLVCDAKDYSVWFKPYGLNCQGSRWGDFASIDRWVETHMPSITNTAERPVFLVHRLDRATSGLMLLCHSKKAARLFSEMFKCGRIDKRYQAIVHGDFSTLPSPYKVDQSLDGKSAQSIFSLAEYGHDCSMVDVSLLTGRKHQIRQHLSGLGFPIVGDRLYGVRGDELDLQLQSVSLGFECPLSHQSVYFQLPEEDRLDLSLVSDVKKKNTETDRGF